MGTVFEAVDRRFGNRVAVKRLDIAGPAVERAFEREARLLRDLKHDGLPRVIDHFEHGRSAYLVMDYVGGDDLSQALETRGCLPVAEVVDIARAVLGILEYLHGRTPPVLHRDIKPQNIKVHEGKVFLLDFGLAKGGVSAREGSAGASSIAGYSPHYAPLEQIRGVGTETWSDVFALAATMYTLLTGTRPADALERAAAAATGAPDPLLHANAHNGSVPAALSDLLQRAMSPNPTLRPQDARAFRRELEEALSGSDGATVVETAVGSGADRTIVETVSSPTHEQTVLATPDSPAAPRRGRRIGRLTFVAVVTLLVVATGSALWVGALSWKSRPSHSSPLLETGATVERDIAPGELHEFHIVARTGDAIRVALNRVEGRRFAVSIANPSGAVLVEVRQGDGARLPVFWIAEFDGVHVVAVRLSKKSGNGHYRLALEQLDEATAADHKLVREQASMLAALAYEAKRERDAHSLRTTGPGRPSERKARAEEMLNQTLAELKAQLESAAAVCRESEEPALEAWALGVGLGYGGKLAESPERDRILEIYRSLEDFQGEADYLEVPEAASLCASRGYRSGEALRLIREGGAAFFLKDYGFKVDLAKLRDELRRALAIARSLKDHEMAAEAASYLTWDAGVSKSEKMELLSEAIEHYRAAGDVGRVALCREVLAWNLQEAGRLAEAAEHQQQATIAYRDAQMPYNRVKALIRLEKILQQSRDIRRANAVGSEARQLEAELGVISDDQLNREVEREVSPIEPDPLSF
jgi:hypothetical protein